MDYNFDTDFKNAESNNDFWGGDASTWASSNGVMRCITMNVPGPMPEYRVLPKDKCKVDPEPGKMEAPYYFDSFNLMRRYEVVETLISYINIYSNITVESGDISIT